MSDKVDSDRKLKSNRTEKHLLIRRLELSQEELNSLPNEYINTRRRQDLKNFIILGNIRLKELELKIIEQEKPVKEKPDINILESSFKELTMIPRTPPSKPADKADGKAKEPEIPEKLSDIIDNTPEDGSNQPDILVSTSTDTAAASAVENPVVGGVKKKKSSLNNVSNIPVTIPEEPTSMATGNKITSTPQYKPLYSDDGSRIHVDRPLHSNEGQTVVNTETTTGAIKKTIKNQTVYEAQQATITDVSDNDQPSKARKIMDSIELRQRHMNRQRYHKNIATGSSSDELDDQEKQQIVSESQKAKQVLKRPVSFNLPAKEISNESKQTELNVTYDIIDETSILKDQEHARQKVSNKNEQVVQQPRTLQQMGNYVQNIPLNQTIPAERGTQVNQHTIQPAQNIPWNQQMIQPFQMGPWNQQGIQPNQMFYPNQIFQPNQMIQPTQMAHATQRFPQHMMSTSQVLFDQTIPVEHQPVQQMISEQPLHANQNYQRTFESNNSMNQSQLLDNQMSMQANQQGGVEANNASGINQLGEEKEQNISTSAQNQRQSARNASTHNRNTATHRQVSHDGDSDEPRVIFLKRLNNIPEFNEESFEHLKKFLEKAETLYYQATNNAEDKEWLQHILIRVNSEARNVICSLDERNWDNIKAALMKRYSYLYNKNLVNTELENLKQGQKESLSEYAERARKLLRKKISMYSYVSPEQRQDYDRYASRSFIQGLNNTNLIRQVKTRGFDSLEKAVENAIDMETDTNSEVSRTELICRFCKAIGHRERDCNRKNPENNAILSLVNALRDVGNVNFGQRNTPFQRGNMVQRLRDQNNRFSNRNPMLNMRNDGFNNFNPNISRPMPPLPNPNNQQMTDRFRNFRENDNRPSNQQQDSRENANRNFTGAPRNQNNNRRLNVVDAFKTNMMKQINSFKTDLLKSDAQGN